jgi:hypothetical protein
MLKKELETMCVNFELLCGKKGCIGSNTECPNYSEGQVEVKYLSLSGDERGIKVINDFSFLKTESGYSLH